MIDRETFGGERTRCGCAKCRAGCLLIPAYLIPHDLPRLAPSMERAELLAWSRQHLRASPGALIQQGGHRVRVRTLVPAPVPGSERCHWLDAAGQCSVHEASPYGCAMFTPHPASHLEELRLSVAGVTAVLEAWIIPGGSAYSDVWLHLDSKGLLASPPSERKEKYHRELQRLDLLDRTGCAAGRGSR